MARTNGPLQVWSRGDTIPTDAQGGYAGGDSTAAAIALFQDSVDMLASEVADIDIGVGSIDATEPGDGTVEITWTGAADAGEGGPVGPVSWSQITGKPAAFPPAPHDHPVSDLIANGTPTGRSYLSGDGQWSVPGAGTSASGACLRFYASGPELHTNSSHVNTAVTGFGPAGDGVDIYDATGKLVVKHTAPGGAISTMGALPDETLTARGISAGCSGGVGTTLIQFAQNGTALDLRVQADYDKVAGQYSNLWIFWLHYAPAGADDRVAGGDVPQ